MEKTQSTIHFRFMAIGFEFRNLFKLSTNIFK